MSKANRSKSGQRGKPGASPQKPRLPSQISVDDIVKRFTICGRCSFFVAGYKLLVGEDGLEKAVHNTDGHWLRLGWRHEMADLVSRSFNVRLDIDYYHYESRCPECRRPFQFRAARGAADADEDGKELEEPLFQIHV
jgi:hypothetical protein